MATCLPSGEWGRDDTQAENWQGTGNSCMEPCPYVLCPDPPALCFQT